MNDLHSTIAKDSIPYQNGNSKFICNLLMERMSNKFSLTNEHVESVEKESVQSMVRRRVLGLPRSQMEPISNCLEYLKYKQNCANEFRKESSKQEITQKGCLDSLHESQYKNCSENKIIVEMPVVLSTQVKHENNDKLEKRDTQKEYLEKEVRVKYCHSKRNKSLCAKLNKNNFREMKVSSNNEVFSENSFQNFSELEKDHSLSYLIKPSKLLEHEVSSTADQNCKTSVHTNNTQINSTEKTHDIEDPLTEENGIMTSLLELVDSYPKTAEGAAALGLLCAHAAMLPEQSFATLLLGRTLVLTEAGKMALQAAKQQEEPLVPRPVLAQSCRVAGHWSDSEVTPAGNEEGANQERRQLSSKRRRQRSSDTCHTQRHTKNVTRTGLPVCNSDNSTQRYTKMLDYSADNLIKTSSSYYQKQEDSHFNSQSQISPSNINESSKHNDRMTCDNGLYMADYCGNSTTLIDDTSVNSSCAAAGKCRNYTSPTTDSIFFGSSYNSDERIGFDPVAECSSVDKIDAANNIIANIMPTDDFICSSNTGTCTHTVTIPPSTGGNLSGETSLSLISSDFLPVSSETIAQLNIFNAGLSNHFAFEEFADFDGDCTDPSMAQLGP